MVTRRDVALRAGTSEAVVSYVVNNGPRNVAPATRERVQAAIRELGYRANSVARSLRTNRTMSIGVVTPDSSNEFFGYLTRAIESVAFDFGYTTLLGNAMEDPERERQYVRTLLDRQVDGLIVIPVPGSTVLEADLDGAPVPFVILDRSLDDEHAVEITVDNEQAARLATSHLLGHGKTRIACVAGPENARTTMARVAGWRRGLIDHGIDPATVPLAYGTFRLGDGYRAGMELLAGEERPDAVFATSDEQAMGVLRAAAELGLRVPDDLAVLGFDGIERGRFSVPSLSTVQQPMEQLADCAFRHLEHRIRDSEADALPKTFATELVLRESCGCRSSP
ncbi:LacI family DNA-binding transcriptional regulator [Amycolatopsis sp. NPDC051102]|uniref:LacI family DNA-binding transcriptional regulator n=1 Tax=Amycolatopsis sp. NPDC051102 TaxID=3155163 RepID=UPI00343B0B9B